MVSALWKAASDGDLTKVRELFKLSAFVDVEIKDHTGATPLIQAVRNGHADVVRELLANGADPFNSSSQGRPDTYTSDPAILDCLRDACEKAAQPNGNAHTNGAAEGYPHDVDHGVQGYHYHPGMAPPAGAYPAYYYAEGHPPGAVPGYYPIPPPQLSPQGDQPQTDGTNGNGNIPPPDIARMIPCRYFPACKYGTSCMFAHPQPTYYAGPPPPQHYPAPYDPNAPPPHFPPMYYPIPPQHFQGGPPPPHVIPPSHSPTTPTHAHQRTSSEPPPVSFSPNTAQFPPPPPPAPHQVPQMGYPMGGPMAPPFVPQNGHPPYPPNMQPAPTMYPPPSAYPPAPPHAHARRDSVGAYAGPPMPQQGIPQESRDPRQPHSAEQDHDPAAHGHHPLGPRDASRGTGRGGMRRVSFGSRKPPCLFFPTGKCRNGDECRFPHVMPDQSSGYPRANGGYGPPPFPSRYPHRPRGFGPIDEKKGDYENKSGFPHPMPNGKDAPVADSYSTHPARPFTNGHHPNHHQHRASEKPVRNGFAPKQPQRIPSADEFPTLNGSSAPTTNGHAIFPNGPTAAQVLKDPAPFRKDSATKGALKSESGSSGKSSPDLRNGSDAKNGTRPLTNGHHVNGNGSHVNGVNGHHANGNGVGDQSLAKLTASMAAVNVSTPELAPVGA
ncbi:hypothetical protein BOTBODRAFT_53326 [Botryobasidium botryosum FD-172 SS1]|uniref:C3H1-type domain-containing protein n=1 Tax=Botryobasidium botryosum (strain FD-172 SS1) TaxID=930990 RepID=A0A067MQ31_BOTB1|nr:hypothetical protein BOTBODRAFT_53326 [Botryobasidium botryosum FD-172 SS1]